ncbi:glycosyltransferase family 9 protein [Shewanella gaetbuli]|uniref:Lipopolysaccharide heptosyltransferase family protein n=1 Tax=Shewanella gaetbuli TaxID=220752 RepID=A0A9X1ZRH2_9GAMM|nr:glycosyltransferase family 9 protein [Shewanella gaetbuli]MCL1144115.1 lipopolysaccharide heptosyltransferase family protein [Shewanella gaetbuli]
MPIISSEKLKNCQRLLFISPLALGDFLYIKTFLNDIKHNFPHIQLDIWLDDNRCNTNEWRLNRSKILQQWIGAETAFDNSYGCCDSPQMQQAQIQQAQGESYDIIICHSGSKSHEFSAIARQISANAYVVSSIASAPFKGILNWYLFRHSDAVYQLDANKLDKNHHITDRYYTVFNDIVGISLQKNQFMPSLAIPIEMTQGAQQWLQANFANHHGKTVLINHLSTNSKRDWLEEQVIELIKQIAAREANTRFVINVTKEHFDAMMALVARSFNKTQTPVAVFTIQENFFELPAIISIVDCVITAETAIVHFATASKTPLIALMRTKKPYWAPPVSNISHVLYATEGRGYVADISVETVYQQYTKMISTH